jgi:hypothetical protein
MTAEENLSKLGVELPEVPVPKAVYKPYSL